MTLFGQLDGNVENVGTRMVQEYERAGYSCHSKVGVYATKVLKDKLASKHISSLGFSDDKLTISLGDVSFKDVQGLQQVFDKVRMGLVLPCPYTIEDSRLGDTREYIKNNKSRITFMTSDERIIYRKKTTDALKSYRKNNPGFRDYTDKKFMDIYPYPYLMQLLPFETQEEFYLNVPSPYTINMRPSKLLARYVEKHIPGISNEYSVALSATRQAEVYLTVDPHIMLMCTEGSTFHSCFEFGGLHHYSAQRFLNGDDTLMAFTLDDKGRINYRNWVMYSPDKTKVVMFKGYSDINEDIVSRVVKQSIAEFLLGTPAFVEGTLDHIDIDVEGDSYIDPTTLMSTQSADTSCWAIDGTHNIVLGDAININTGCITYNEALQSCRCVECGDSYSEDEGSYIESIDDFVCEGCMGEYYTYLDSRGYVRNINIICDVHDTPYHRDYIDEECGMNANDGEWYPLDELVFAEDMGEYYLPEDIYYSEIDGCYYADEENMPVEKMMRR